MVVHSNGLDEIRLDAPTHVVELKQGDITEYDISPESLVLHLKTPRKMRASLRIQRKPVLLWSNSP